MGQKLISWLAIWFAFWRKFIACWCCVCGGKISDEEPRKSYVATCLCNGCVGLVKPVDSVIPLTIGVRGVIQTIYLPLIMVDPTPSIPKIALFCYSLCAYRECFPKLRLVAQILLSGSLAAQRQHFRPPGSNINRIIILA